MAKIGFNLMRIFIETKDRGECFIEPKLSNFANLGNESYFQLSGVCYEVFATQCSDYIWLVFECGKANPRDEQVTNIVTYSKSPNPRGENEVELLHQTFVLFHFSKNTLYLSDSRKKGVVETFLKDQLSTNFSIQGVYKTADDMIKVLKHVDKISFTDIRSLFNQDSKERQALIDLTGVDAPEKFSIEAKYKKANIKDFIQRLLSSKKEHKTSDLIICGRDENDFEFVYNSDSFSRKIDIDCSKETNGKYCSNIVLKTLIEKIKHEG